MDEKIRGGEIGIWVLDTERECLCWGIEVEDLEGRVKMLCLCGLAWIFGGSCMICSHLNLDNPIHLLDRLKTICPVFDVKEVEHRGHGPIETMSPVVEVKEVELRRGEIGAQGYEF